MEKITKAWITNEKNLAKKCQQVSELTREILIHAEFPYGIGNNIQSNTGKHWSSGKKRQTFEMNYWSLMSRRRQYWPETNTPRHTKYNWSLWILLCTRTSLCQPLLLLLLWASMVFCSLCSMYHNLRLFRSNRFASKKKYFSAANQQRKRAKEKGNVPTCT